MDKLKEKWDELKGRFFSKNGVSFANLFLIFAFIYNKPVITLIAAAVWLVYLVWSIKNTEYTFVRIINAACILLGLYLIVTSLLSLFSGN